MRACGSLGVLLLPAVVLAAAPATGAPASLGGDARARVRVDADGRRVLEVRQGAGGAVGWRAPDEAADEEERVQLVWTSASPGEAPAALRYRQDEAVHVCGQGPALLAPERFDAVTRRWSPLPGWLPAPATTLTGEPVPAAAKPPSPLATACSFLGDSPASAAAGAVAALGDGDPHRGWGRRPGHLASPLIGSAVLDLESEARELRLHSLPGQPWPRELWLYWEGTSLRLVLPAPAAPGEVRFVLPPLPASRCLGLVLPPDVGGALGEARLLTRLDLAPPAAALREAAALVGDGGAGGRAAARRLRGTGEAGLRALAALPNGSLREPALWGQAVGASAAPEAATLLLDRLESLPPAPAAALGPALLGLGPQTCHALAARLAGRDSSSLARLLAWTGGWEAGLPGCLPQLRPVLGRLLAGAQGPAVLLRSLALAEALGDPVAQPAVLELTRHPEEQVRRRALATFPALVRRHPGAGAPADLLETLAPALADPSPDVRRQGLLTLARLAPPPGGGDPALSALFPGRWQPEAERLLHADPWPEVREAALLLLVQGGAAPAALPGLLTRALRDDSPLVRFQALRGCRARQLAGELLPVLEELAGASRELRDLRREAVALLPAAGPPGLAARARLADRLQGAGPEEESTRLLLARDVAQLLGRPVPALPAPGPAVAP